MVGITANPTNPKDREKLQLPPKSYAAAAVEEETPHKQDNGTANGNAATNGGVPQHKVSVLKIVDTFKDEANKRPDMERQESQYEFSAEVPAPSLFFVSID